MRLRRLLILGVALGDSDIRGFTAMSEKMSPEEIYGALNEYFEEMCRIVFAYGGYVDRFIGDCSVTT